jgi:hypothetical protein
MIHRLLDTLTARLYRLADLVRRRWRLELLIGVRLTLDRDP